MNSVRDRIKLRTTRAIDNFLFGWQPQGTLGYYPLFRAIDPGRLTHTENIRRGTYRKIQTDIGHFPVRITGG